MVDKKSPNPVKNRGGKPKDPSDKKPLTQWETEEENQKTGGNVPLIDREHNGNILLLDSEHSGDVLLIDREHPKAICYSQIESTRTLEDDFEYISLPKLTELVKKPSNLTRTGKKKHHCPISHFLPHFVEPIGRPRFCFAEGLTDGLVMGGAQLSRREIAVGFSG